LRRRLSAEDAALLGGANLSSAKTGAVVVATLPAAPSADVLAARARAVLRLLDGARHVALRCATKLPQTLAAASEPHFCIVDGFGRERRSIAIGLYVRTAPRPRRTFAATRSGRRRRGHPRLARARPAR
jgi:hypothetical protein